MDLTIYFFSFFANFLVRSDHENLAKKIIKYFRYEHCFEVKPPFTPVLSTLNLFGILANASVIFLLLRGRCQLLQKHPVNILLLNMCISDLLNLCINPVLFLFREGVVFRFYLLSGPMCRLTPYFAGEIYIWFKTLVFLLYIFCK